MTAAPGVSDSQERRHNRVTLRRYKGSMRYGFHADTSRSGGVSERVRILPPDRRPHKIRGNPYTRIGRCHTLVVVEGPRNAYQYMVALRGPSANDFGSRSVAPEGKLLFTKVAAL